MSNALQKLPTYIQEKVSSATVPIQYTAAIKALAQCRDIDEAKYFADKSEALAAWAKIYKHDEAAVEAKRLKLHAYRRMGILAKQLQPQRSIGGTQRGSSPGPSALLKAAGLAKHERSAATALSRLPEKKFSREVSSEKPHAPSHFINTLSKASDGWLLLSRSSGQTLGQSGGIMASFRCFCNRNDPKQIARLLTKSETKKAKLMATEILEWMDEFDQNLR